MLSSVLAAFGSSPPPAAHNPQREPRHPGDDTSPTTHREILGWYCYGIAAEVFAICGVGSFLPLTLEQLARERGTLQTSHQPCWGPDAPENNGDEQCVVGVFGLQITTASFAMYTFSLAVLVQALTLISFSALADYGNNRKSLLLSFGFVGAAASMLFVFIAPPVFLLGSILTIVGVTCLGSSHVVLNSFLPVLVANDASIQQCSDMHGDELSVMEQDDLGSEWNNREDENSNEHSVNGMHDASREESFKRETSGSASPELQRSTQISAKGVGLGYSAAVFVQCLSILLLIALNKTSLPKISGTLPTRFVLFLVGVWWATFTLVARRWLRARPGPPLQTGSNHKTSKFRLWLRLVGFAWKSLWNTVKVAIQLREVVVFLVGWFLLSDAMATVSSTAILFARTELQMSTIAVGTLSITATMSGMTGAFLWPHVSRYFNLQENHTIMVCLALFEIIPLYGMLAYIPFVRNWGVFGLQQPWEIFPLAIIHGIVSGGLNSYCRSFFGLLIPPGSEAAFYALYAATDKGSSFIGPAIVGGLIDATGQVRSAFFFIALLIVLPIPLVYMVNAEKGRREGVAMAGRLDKGHDGAAQDAQEAEGLLTRPS